ncbi:MAG: hypothetical protein KG075_21810, partial [Alphaproteobacteria bacterium]|nr:hypothetical protein [Alphaproteobacteria bacterium]
PSTPLLEIKSEGVDARRKAGHDKKGTVVKFHSHTVILGLDPRISCRMNERVHGKPGVLSHSERGWILGSSPRMTVG